MDKIEFSYNWNGKLNCKCFTTIRKHVEGKYPIDKELEVYLKTELKGVARIHDKYVLKMSQLKEWMCFLDTGYCKDETISILRKMHHLTGNQDLEVQVLLLIYKQ